MNSLIEIYDELSLTFDSVESFEKFYDLKLRNHKVELYRRNLKSQLFEIHTYLKGIFSEKIKGKTIKLWVNKVAILKGYASAICFNITNELNEYSTYRHTPEALFQHRIEYDMNETGKSYEQLEPMYLKIIEDRIKVLERIKPFIEAGSDVITISYNKMYSIFKPLLGDNNLAKRNAESGNRSSSFNQNIESKQFNNIDDEKMKDFKTFEKMRGNIDNTNIDKLYNKLILPPAIIENVSKEEFRCLFKYEESSIRINWKVNKNQLSHFIRKLISKEYKFIKKHQCWEITSYYIKVNNESIKAVNLRTAKPPSKDAMKMIDDRISFLKLQLQF